jgi:hypothetical protein
MDLAITSVDIYSPHPSFTACKGSPLSQQELDVLVADMQRYDAFYGIPTEKVRLAL